MKNLRRVFALLMTLAVLGFSALSCQSSEHTTRPAEIGMTLHLRGADAAAVKREFDLMSAMNVSWVRMDVDWSWIETRRGVMDWTQPDTIVSAAAEHGISVLGVLAYSPTWAAAPATGHSSTTSYSRPRYIEDYGNFARIAAQRYAPRGVHTWEIWNEPNTGHFWPPLPDAIEYGRLFRVAADAIRKIDPTATLLIGGLAPQPDPPDIGDTPANYLDQLYRDGAAQLADGIAIHPYSFPALPMQKSGQPAGGFKDLPDLHAVMEEHGDGQTKIWITELGAPTGTSPYAVTQLGQATTLLQARKQVEQWDWAGPLIYYELVDGGTDPAEKEENFGVLRQDLTVKLAALALMGTMTGEAISPK